ncbi:MAG: DUF2793 domain-containing protein [Proteobacteria bacterium]|nr:DUF2793 domain-containing protein [Pseudomonadota bacterium]
MTVTTQTTNLQLPLLAAGQAQKHVTHNEALLQIDALVQLSVEGVVNVPPSSPAEGARYLVGTAPTGAFAGKAGRVAVVRDAAWRFHAPARGWLAYVVASDAIYTFTGTLWRPLGSAFEYLGIAATADATQRLAVKSANVLFDHDGASSRVKINRKLVSDTASLLFQTDYAGRAEVGLAGDAQFRVKVSADGNAWINALTVDPATGLAQAAAAPTTALGLATKGYVDTVGRGDPGAFDYQTAAAVAITGSSNWTKVTGFSTARIPVAAFSGTNSQFVAPVAGVYFFTGQLHLSFGAGGGNPLVAFARNSAPSGSWISKAFPANATDALQINSLLKLNAGDTVEIHVFTNASCTVNAGYSSFGGTRL